MGWIESLHALDWTALGLLAIFLLLGLLRGSAWQARRFLAILLALLIAGLISPIASPTVGHLVGRSGPGAALGIVYAFLFLFTLAFLALLFRFLKPQVARERQAKRQENGVTSTQPKRRIWGAALGILTAAALYLAGMAFFFVVSPAESARSLGERSHGARFSAHAIAVLRGVFPREIRDRASFLLRTETPR